jgi:tetratricopeptide (TPR) repeat protein
MIEAAADHYTRLCELDPEQTELQLGLANLLLKQGEHQKAIARYEYALSLEPDNWTAHNDVVSAYEEAGLIREAIEHLHKMVEQQPEFADTRLRLGDMYARIGNDSAATLQYERAAQISPDYLEANVKLGTQHLRAGRFEQASQWFSTALELNDRLLSAYVGIGVAQHASGRTTEALSSFEMARNIEPNSTLLFSEVARMHLKAAAGQQSGRFILGSTPSVEQDTPEHVTDLLSQQIQRVREAVAQNPNHADLHYRLGLLLRNRGQLDDAIASFRQAATINPTYMKALIKLGLALSEADQTEEAIEVFKQATDVRPDYVDLHYQIGLLFVQRNQFEMAVEHFEQAVSGNPGNVAFQANLALSLQNMGLIDRAQATWQIVSELAPDSEYAEQAQRAMAKSREE